MFGTVVLCKGYSRLVIDEWAGLEEVQLGEEAVEPYC